MTTYGTTAQRVLVNAAQEMLAHAASIEVLGSFGLQKEQPMRKTDTISWRRMNVFNQKANGTPDIDPAAFRLTEGVNPPTHGHTYTDVTSQLKEYGYVEKFSSKAAEMYADDIPGDARTMTAEVLTEVTELVRYGQLKGGTVVDYANGTTRAGIDTPIQINQIRRAVRTLQSARAFMVTKKLDASPDYGTSPIKPAFIAFGHTDLSADLEDLPGWIGVEEYASGTPVHAREVGAVPNVRFVLSPLFVPFLGAGAAVGSTGMKAEDDTNIDVYPVIIVAENAWGQVALRGARAITPVLIPARPSAATPLGRYGFVGAKIWMDVVRLNENWMVRLECAVSDLAA
jgi:N4-gp56 family major capsid protein